MTVAESPVGACWELSIVEPCKPHLLSGTDDNSGSGIEGVAALRAPQSSGFQRDFVVGLRPLQEHFGASDCIFWSLLGAPKEAASPLKAASPKKPKAR